MEKAVFVLLFAVCYVCSADILTNGNAVKRYVDVDCRNNADGNYSTADTFSYINCARGRSKRVHCNADTGDLQYIFDAVTRSCAPAATLSPDTFCLDRREGNYNNPWNCHTFFQCFLNSTYKMSCQDDRFVYSTAKDLCDETTVCRQVSTRDAAVVKGRTNVRDDNPCDNIPDGIYPFRDVFVYLNCKGGKGHYTDCGNNQIFEPGRKKCVDASTVDQKSFCTNRTNGDWSNPWDCHSFFKCYYNFPKIYKCQLATLVFNPYKDQCVYPKEHRCKQLPSKTRSLAEGVVRWSANMLEEDETQRKTVTSTSVSCQGKPDGVYPVPDVFKYLVCQNDHGSLDSCDTNMMFEPGQKKCVDVRTQSVFEFCRNRTDGNYRNPWACHRFIMCNSQTSFNKPCPLDWLIFNPNDGQCEPDFPCTQVGLTKEDIIVSENNNNDDDDFCKTKSDGDYAIPDVFSYIKCNGHKSTKYACDTNMIFSAKVKECVAVSSQSIVEFCNGRADGDWRNPWNCYSAIACVGEMTKIVPCLINGFVFDPEKDVCMKTAVCKVVGSGVGGVKERPDPELDCSRKSDGNYAIRDVMRYLQCRYQVPTVVPCQEGQVYEMLLDKCINASKVSAESFCIKQPDGHYRNPWDCHGYISCINGRSIERKCAIDRLVYNPYTDSCEWPSEQWKCKAYPSGKPNLFPPKARDEYCRDSAATLPYVEKRLICTNPFKYIQCSANGTASLIPCPPNQIFIAESLTCADPNKDPYKRTEDDFCSDRLDTGFRPYSNTTGQYLNPWNCHKLLACLGPVSLIQPCNPSKLIFHPDTDRCEYNGTCTIINSTDTLRTRHNVEEKPTTAYKPQFPHLDSVQIKDICTYLDDGMYAIRDVLQYLECKNHTSNVVDCPTGTIYLPGGKNCTNATGVNEDNFCNNRAEGNWRNPWNCHEYFTCRTPQPIHTEECNVFVTLNYDPVNDYCDYPSVVKCKELPKKVNKASTPAVAMAIKRDNADDFCKGKKDGKYAIADVFVYIDCKGGKSTKTNCPSQEIFSEVDLKCVSIATQSFTQFCNHRESNIDWRNPWDCSSYIDCANGRSLKRKCLINGFVFNPDEDVCMKPSQFPCFQVGSAREMPKSLTENTPALIQSIVTGSVQMKDICTQLEDGIYPIRDVMQYLECKKGESNFVNCPKGTIYVSGKNCTNATKFNEENFCTGRVEGNYRNPWDCHSYYTCHNYKTFKRQCNPFVTLNYDPVLDVCGYPADVKCKQLDSSKEGISRKAVEAVPSLILAPALKVSSDDNPCKNLKDGRYAVRDVAKYLLCHFRHGHVLPCRSGRIFSPKNGRCVPVNRVDPETFCVGRTDGNFRNPWNCHRYFTCHAERTFDRPCSNLTILNYDPEKDLCEHPYIKKCVNITASSNQVKLFQTLKMSYKKPEEKPEDACAVLKDGIYAVRDVAKYLVCRSKKGQVLPCEPGQIFVPGNVLKCVAIGQVDPETFCEQRRDGNFRNPWNCHRYFTCSNERTLNRPCSNLTILNYDPVTDLCSHPYQAKCENITESVAAFRHSPLEPSLTGSTCSHLRDGKYAMRDVFMYLECTKHVGTVKACKVGTYFDAVKRECVDNQHKLDATSFCRGRSTGNWGNPWNCHNYITCTLVRGYDRPCSTKVLLNYNPHDDRCEFPEQHLCKQLPSVEHHSKIVEEVLTNGRIIL